MRASTRTALRLFKKHIARFFTIIAIVVVSIGFMSGVGEVENKLRTAVNDYYKSQNIADLYLKSSNLLGFSQDEINWITTRFGEDNILQSYCYEDKFDGEIIRIYNYNLDTSINKLELLEGKLPTESNQIVAERKTSKIKGYNLGDTITIQGTEYTVCGIVANPYLVNQVEEPSFRYNDEYLSNVVYINSTPFATNDIYISLENRQIFKAFSNEYKTHINSLKTEISQHLSTETVTTLSLYENTGVYPMICYAEKVGTISIIFVVFFLLVTLLVVYSTMSRLLDEERAQIACQKTLGYSNLAIVSRYLWFVIIATLVGGLLSFGVGLGLTNIIYSTFNLQYRTPPFPTQNNFIFYILSFAIILIGNAILTLATGLKLTNNKPVTLLSPKVAKSGKKVFLERMPFIWNKISFRYKSTLRNVFLFKSRFFMTVISIIGSTVLVFAGMGLMDCSTQIEGGSSLITISIALVIFSAVLCALVIYNITNINISERNREISTLMVLGYHDHEVTGYIFREIYIMSAIGALLGLPVGSVFIEFLFSLIDFGSLADINWWTWVLTPIITMFFTSLSTLLLKHKIIKTDMNASLKSIE